MLDIAALVQNCAADVPSSVMQAVVSVESSKNPFAIGVVGGRLQRQPRTLSEALATAEMLERSGWNFSLGVAQVNRYNLSKYGLDYQRAFDPCKNLQAASKILNECYGRAHQQEPNGYKAWQMAFSCYYSGNFSVGFKHGYVQKVVSAMGSPYSPVLPSMPVQATVGEKLNVANLQPSRSVVAANVGRLDASSGGQSNRVPDRVFDAHEASPVVWLGGKGLLGQGNPMAVDMSDGSIRVMPVVGAPQDGKKSPVVLNVSTDVKVPDSQVQKPVVLEKLSDGVNVKPADQKRAPVLPQRSGAYNDNAERDTKAAVVF